MTVREEQGNLKQTVYITSDRKRFRDRSEADVHEKYLGWAQKVQQLGIKENNGAYYCETEKQFDTVLLMLMYQKGFYNWKKQEEDARKLKEIKESLYFLAEQKQTNLFRMARRLLDHHGNPSLVREIQEEAWKLTSHPEILLDEDELKYALLV